MRIGVVAAMEPELRTITRSAVSAKSRAPIIVPPRGSTRSEILAIVSGIGARHARDAAQRLLDAGATALVSWGCAGGLQPQLRVGTLLLPAAVIAVGGERYRADPAWHAELGRRIGEDAPETGALIEAAHAVADARAKAALAAASGAVAVDMESASVAAVAAAACVPFVAVRAISDTATCVVPEVLTRTVGLGELSAMRAFAALAASPSSWFNAIQLGFGFRAALATLSRTAELVFSVSTAGPQSARCATAR